MTFTNDYRNRSANLSLSMNNDYCSLTSTGILLREAEKLYGFDGFKSRNVPLGICSKPYGFALQGPRKLSCHLNCMSGVRDSIEHSQGEAVMPGTNSLAVKIYFIDISNSVYECYFYSIDTGVSCEDIRTPNSITKL